MASANAVVGVSQHTPLVPQASFRTRIASRAVTLLPVPVASVTTRIPARPCPATDGNRAITDAWSAFASSSPCATSNGSPRTATRPRPESATTSLAFPRDQAKCSRAP